MTAFEQNADTSTGSKRETRVPRVRPGWIEAEAGSSYDGRTRTCFSEAVLTFIVSISFADFIMLSVGQHQHGGTVALPWPVSVVGNLSATSAQFIWHHEPARRVLFTGVRFFQL